MIRRVEVERFTPLTRRALRSSSMRSIPLSRSHSPTSFSPLTQLLRQGDAKVFKKYSQMKLQMKRVALTKLNRQANEGDLSFGTVQPS